MKDKRTLATLGWAAFASPVGFMAANATRNPSITRVFLAVGLLLGLGVVFFWLLRLLGTSHSSHGVEAAVALIIWSYFGMLGSQFSNTDGISFLVLGTLVAIGGGLLIDSIGRRRPLVYAVARTAIVAAVIGPLILLVALPLNARASGDLRDVLVVFVDGYASQDTLHGFGYDNSAFYEELEKNGFSVQPNAASSYSMTYLSVASTLALGYLAEGGDPIQGDLRERMYETMGGSNRFVQAFQDLGYKYVHVESGWSGTRCGTGADRCFHAPLIDDTVWNLTQRTAAAKLLQQTVGHAFVVGGLETVETLSTLPLNAAVPELIFAHLLLPHPPMFLTSDCSFRGAAGESGLNLWAPYLGGTEARARRVAAYLEQLSCTNELVTRIFKDDTFSKAVVVVIGDHGPDSRGQLVTPVAEWDDLQVAERLNTLLAVRGCGPHLPDEVINALIFVSDCIGAPTPGELEYRSFLVPVEENHPRDLVVETSFRGR